MNKVLNVLDELIDKFVLLDADSLGFSRFLNDWRAWDIKANDNSFCLMSVVEVSLCYRSHTLVDDIDSVYSLDNLLCLLK